MRHDVFNSARSAINFMGKKNENQQFVFYNDIISVLCNYCNDVANKKKRPLVRKGIRRGYII